MAKVTKTDGALEALKVAIGAARTLTQTEADLRAQHGALLAERKTIVTAHPSEAEVIANAHRLVDEHAAKWAQARGLGFVRELGGHETHAGDGSSRQLRIAPKLPSWGDLQGSLRFEDLCGLAPALVKARLVEVVHQSGARFGLPAEERRAKLAALDAEIAAVEDQHLQLVVGAAEVGITLPLLATVAKRREAEAAEAERAARLVADRERGIFPVSLGPAPPAVTGGSVGGRA